MCHYNSTFSIIHHYLSHIANLRNIIFKVSNAAFRCSSEASDLKGHISVNIETSMSILVESVNHSWLNDNAYPPCCCFMYFSITDICQLSLAAERQHREVLHSVCGGRQSHCEVKGTCC